MPARLDCIRPASMPLAFAALLVRSKSAQPRISTSSAMLPGIFCPTPPTYFNTRKNRGQTGLSPVFPVLLNYRDLKVATGAYERSAINPRVIPLSDGASEVVEAGSGVARVKVGDRVAAIFVQRWLAGGFRGADQVRNSEVGEGDEGRRH
ncbi:MAG: hypothetical protein A3G24_22870 [Betaproteobacteria bacterium RIFCSPLOWO2_12_FULL_62_13]|nr:MAG: hypothetical protein A3G24_22870 [Betaproteobacteria bacterium RIFCSPLOWO2_12_FULL_62_13]